MAIVLRLILAVLFAGVLSAVAEDCQPCEDPSQIFCC
jgi:hypothetical protein